MARRQLWTDVEVADLWKLKWQEFLAKYPHRTEGAYWLKRHREDKAGRRPPEPEEEDQEATLSALEDLLLKALTKRTLTTAELVEIVDRSPKTVTATLERLRNAGYEIEVDTDAEQVTLDRQRRPTNWTVDLAQYYGERLKLAIISCTHFGNRYRQLGALTGFYRICERDKVGAVVHLGDLTDGINMYRGQEFDLYAHGADAQVQASAEEYPESELPTYLIGGNHDYSFVKTAGSNVVRRVCDEREGLIYAGMLAATISVGPGVKFLAMHSRGGVPYARSYRSQKLNEQLGRGERVPDVFGVGGLHVIDYVHYLGVHTFLAGCFQGQTPYLKEKGLFPEIGGWIVEFNIGDDGRLNRCKPEWISFEEADEFGS